MKMDFRIPLSFLRQAFVLTAPLCLVASELNAQGAQYREWGMNHMFDGRFWWFGGIFMILFWLLILLGILALVRWLIQSGRKNNLSASAPSESALDILKKRYARGEISKEQLEAMKRDIE